MEEKKAIKFDASAKMYKKIAERRLEENDLEGALSFLHSAKEKTKYRLSIYSDIADIYFEMGLYDLSANYWFKVLDIVPKQNVTEVYNALGSCYYNLRNYGVAAYYFNEQFENLKGGNLLFDEEMADCFSELLDIKNAYRVVYPPEAVDYSDTFKKGKNALMRYDLDGAISIFETIHESAKEYETAMLECSVAKFLKGDVDGAIQLSEKIHQRNSKNVFALCNLSTMYRFKEMPIAAEKYFSLIDEENIKDDDDLFKVASTFCENAKHERALKCFEKLSVSRPYNTSVMFFHGACLYNTGRFEESRSVFSRLIRLTEANPVALYFYRLSDLAVKQGAKATKPIAYHFNLPIEKEDENLKKLTTLLNIKSVTTVKKKVKEKEIIELINWCFTVRDREVQKGACYLLAVSDNKASENKLLEKLLEPSIFDETKEYIITLLVLKGYDKTCGVVLKNIYKKICFYALELEGQSGEKVEDAYAVTFAKAVVLGNFNLRKIYDIANEFYYLYEYAPFLKNVDKHVLAAYLYYKSGIEVITLTEVSEIFSVKKNDLKTFMENVDNYEQND